MDTKSKRISIIFAALAALAIISGCTPAIAEQPSDSPRYEFRDISDYFEPRVPCGAARIVEWQEQRAAEKAAQAEWEAAEAAAAAEAEYEPEYADYAAYSAPQSVMGNPDGLNSFHGTFDFNGHKETFYANHAVYDDQLTVDDQGFFRDDQGRYVVDSSDYPIGTEIEISQGTAIVMDDGADHGIVDVHTTWGR